MQQKITLSIDDQIYKKIHFLIPKRKMSKFVEDCVREKIEKYRLEDPIEKGFKMMGKNQTRENEAYQWSEAAIGEEL